MSIFPGLEDFCTQPTLRSTKWSLLRLPTRKILKTFRQLSKWRVEPCHRTWFARRATLPWGRSTGAAARSADGVPARRHKRAQDRPLSLAEFRIRLRAVRAGSVELRHVFGLSVNARRAFFNLRAREATRPRGASKQAFRRRRGPGGARPPRPAPPPGAPLDRPAFQTKIFSLHNCKLS